MRQRDNEQVKDYKALAIRAFKNTARTARRMVIKLGCYQDWKQECELAAWAAESQGMRLNAAMRFCQRAAYRFLVTLGFARPNRAPSWELCRPISLDDARLDHFGSTI